MLTQTEFEEFVHRLRQGDEGAWAEFVQRHEREVRRVIRSRLGPAFRPILDSVDVWQSLLASVFVRLSLGQYHLDTPQDLVKLLARMARNKVISHGRNLQASCRDQRRLAAGSADLDGVAAPGPTPSEAVSLEELLRLARDQLTAEELRLANLKGQGYGWQEIAAALGGEPDALRMRLTRAVDRAARHLHLAEGTDA